MKRIRSALAKIAVALVLLAAWALSDPRIVPPVGPLVEGRQLVRGPFTDCHRQRSARCVVDGDTIRLDGRDVRLVGYNTPEYAGARCEAERRLAVEASAALLEMLEKHDLMLVADRRNASDRYGRPLRSGLLVGEDGREASLADAMIATGLAEPYYGGARRAWC